MANTTEDYGLRMNTEDGVKLVAALAQEVEITDSINWDTLNLSRESKCMALWD